MKKFREWVKEDYGTLERVSMTVEVREGMSLVFARLTPKDGGWHAEWTMGGKEQEVFAAGGPQDVVREVRSMLVDEERRTVER